MIFLEVLLELLRIYGGVLFLDFLEFLFVLLLFLFDLLLVVVLQHFIETSALLVVRV